jgi:hypothetical protein
MPDMSLKNGSLQWLNLSITMGSAVLGTKKARGLGEEGVCAQEYLAPRWMALGGGIRNP